jgi:hypothetical protein
VDDNESVALSLPVPLVAAGLLVGLAVAAYVLMGHDSAGADQAGSLRKPVKKFRRKMGLTTLITLIENDTTRKLLVTALKAMARRS